MLLLIFFLALQRTQHVPSTVLRRVRVVLRGPHRLGDPFLLRALFVLRVVFFASLRRIIVSVVRAVVFVLRVRVIQIGATLFGVASFLVSGVMRASSPSAFSNISMLELVGKHLLRCQLASVLELLLGDQFLGFEFVLVLLLAELQHLVLALHVR